MTKETRKFQEIIKTKDLTIDILKDELWDYQRMVKKFQNLVTVLLIFIFIGFIYHSISITNLTKYIHMPVKSNVLIGEQTNEWE